MKKLTIICALLALSFTAAFAADPAPTPSPTPYVPPTTAQVSQVVDDSAVAEIIANLRASTPTAGDGSKLAFKALQVRVLAGGKVQITAIYGK